MELSLKNVSYTYQAGTPFERQALFDVSLSIKEKSYTAIIGHTGSGKSTLMQLLNGLNLPTEGEVIVGNTHITSTSNLSVKKLDSSFNFQRVSCLKKQC